MPSFFHSGDTLINLDHVCSAKWEDDHVTVCLDSGAAIRLSCKDSAEFAVAVGKEVRCKPLEVPPKEQPNGLKELSSTHKAK